MNLEEKLISKDKQCQIVCNYLKELCNNDEYLRNAILEKEKNGKMKFKLDKLDSIKNGDIIVIPKNQINTQVLSGVYYKPIRIHYSKLYKSKTGVIAPKKYKKVLK